MLTAIYDFWYAAHQAEIATDERPQDRRTLRVPLKAK